MNEITVSSSNSAEVEVRNKYQRLLAEKITGKRVIFGVAATVGLLAVGAAVIQALVLGLQVAALGALLAALVFGGIIAWKMVPRILLSVENRERERIMAEMNRHLAALKSEARANPIEQLQNYLLEKQKQLNDFKTAVTQIGGQVKTMVDMLRERKAAKPGKDYSKKDEALTAMKAAYDGLRRKADQGDVAILDLREVIEDQKFDWKFAQVGQSAMQNLRAMNGADLLNEILAGESFDQVRENFNRVFTEIEVEIGNINSGKALTFGEGNDGFTIDVSAIRINQPELVPVESTRKE
jgi:hypothetical protein